MVELLKEIFYTTKGNNDRPFKVQTVMENKESFRVS